jgi:hypothetical protein
MRHSVKILILRKIVNLLFFLLCCVCCPLALANTRYISEEKPFYIGVSIYEYYMAQVAKEQGKDYSAFLEQHLGILREKGVNFIYLGGVTPERFEEHLRLAEKYEMKLIPQLDFVYFLPDWSDEQMDDNARRAGQFIRKYNHYPQILAWSVKEEVARKDIYRLAEYYKKILKYAPDARFQLTNNNISCSDERTSPQSGGRRNASLRFLVDSLWGRLFGFTSFFSEMGSRTSRKVLRTSSQARGRLYVDYHSGRISYTKASEHIC